MREISTEFKKAVEVSIGTKMSSREWHSTLEYWIRPSALELK
jgi:hypothetical protein